MLNILVCTADACKRQAAYDIFARLEALTALHHLEKQVAILPSGCLGVCRSEGITIQIGNNLYTGLCLQNVDYVFQEYVLDLLQTQAS